MKKIGILYICTGKYNVFWKDFYQSCEKYFLLNNNKEYFVFTDSEEIYGEYENPKIHKIYQQSLGWPDNTLMRFKMFYGQKEKLSEFDYLFFFNANLLFTKPIDEEFLPVNENLLVVKHPGYYKADIYDVPYSRDKSSLAYIPIGEGQIYVQGALNGGKSGEFLKLIETLHFNILKDKENGIVAIWHDESHLNRYIYGRNDLKILGPEYVNQEGKNYGVSPMIISRNKNQYADVDALRGIQKSYFRKIFEKIKIIVRER